MRPTKQVWVSWCQRCDQFTAAGTARGDVLSDCPYCPPETPTEALLYAAVKSAKKPRKARKI